MLSAGDADRVAALIRETAAAELRPRFRNLAQEDIRLKRPGDFVTVADVASEQRLAAGLATILPGVPVVGEEAAEKDPGLLDLITRPDEACWIVDPLDGTANFASGKDRFAIIVGLVRSGRTVAGWIFDVSGDRMAVAQEGQGVLLDGRNVHGMATSRPPNGLVGHKIRKEFNRQLPKELRRQLGRLGTLNCAGVEYIEILSGRWDFSLYRMTKPWDHAAGALLLAEAGGGALRFDGSPYGPSQNLDSGIMGAATIETLAEVQRMFAASRAPLLTSSG